jgi:isopenicillin-N N-acyltransferase-like protein
MEPVLFDQDDPAERGRAHGELWRDDIATLAGLRLELALKKGSFRDRTELLDLARAHLPILHTFDEALHAELVGIAEGAALDPALVVVLNHYTDLRDIVPGVSAAADDDPGGCTAIYAPGDTGPMLGQTWDMHASAEPFVRAIRVQPRSGRDEVVCLTLTGCLGMAGMSATGVAVTINNLTSTDARVGTVWPAVVRALLRCRDAVSARDVLLSTRLSSGHHYMIADGSEFFGIETSGRLKMLTQLGPKVAHLHTNHCFDPVLRRHEAVPRASSTFARLDAASTLYVQLLPRTPARLWELLSSHDGWPRSICSHLDDESGDPSASKTCAIMVMELVEGRLHLGRGCGHTSEPITARLERWRARPAPASEDP